jgi:histidinol-phosphate aminotransferase
MTVLPGATAVPVPNTADGGHDLDAMADAITDRTRLVIVCSPNNPTGAAVTQAAFEAFLARVPDDVLVILDEAYAEFVTDVAVVNGRTLALRHPNLVVLRTFSKAYGLAGLRIGYGVGPAPILAAARTTIIPLSVTDAAQQAAVASLDRVDELHERVAHIAARRDRVWAALVEQGWAVPKPHGNFVWLPTGAHSERAAEVFAEHGAVVRAYLPDGVRVTIGEDESVEHVLAAAAEIVETLQGTDADLQVR